MRAAAAAKGRRFLDAFSPTAGNPFANVAEWEFFSAAPAVWLRFLVDAPLAAASLQLKGSGEAASTADTVQQAAAGGSSTSGNGSAVLQLGGDGLEQAMSALMHAMTRAGPPSDGSMLTVQLAVGDGSSSEELRLSASQASGVLALLDDAATCMPAAPKAQPTPGVAIAPPSLTARVVGRAAQLAVAALKAGVWVGLAALPLLAVLRPYRDPAPAASQQPPMADVVHRARAPPAAGSGRPAGVQPRKPSQLQPGQLQQLCSQTEALARGMWVAAGAGAAAGAAPDSGCGAAASPVWREPAVYQVAVAADSGQPLGCWPVNDSALHLHQQLPLAAEVRAPGAGARLAQQLAQRSPEQLQAQEVGKPPEDLTSGYAPAARQQLPPGGVVVLRLELAPAAEEPPNSTAGHEGSSGATAAGSSGSSSSTWQWVGTGKHRVLLAPLQPRASAWEEGDSLRAWGQGT
jgi:hypothetical protein